MKLPDPVRRALRTFVQDFIRTFLLLVTVPNVIQGAVTDLEGVAQRVPDPSVLLSALVAGAWAGVLAVLTFILNALEDSTGVPVSLVPKAATAPALARDNKGRFTSKGYSAVEVLLVVFLALIVLYVLVKIVGPAL